MLHPQQSNLLQGGPAVNDQYGLTPTMDANKSPITNILTAKQLNDYSWVSQNGGNPKLVLGEPTPINSKMRNKKDRKLEIRKLESSLEQLMINLGLNPAAKEPTSSSEETEEEEEEVEIEEPKPPEPEPVKKHQEDNKLG